jgi:hypothetical protein
MKSGEKEHSWKDENKSEGEGDTDLHNNRIRKSKSVTDLEREKRDPSNEKAKQLGFCC